MIASGFDYDRQETERQFDLAMQGTLVSGEVYGLYAGYRLAPLGRIREALDLMRKVVDLDPLNVFWRQVFGTYLLMSERFDEAEAEARKGLEIDPGSWPAILLLGGSCFLSGKLEEARMALEHAHELAPWNGALTGFLAGALARVGERDRAESLVAQLAAAPSGAWGMVFYHCLNGDLDAAADWYDKAIEQRLPVAVAACRHPLLKPLRESPRWPALAKMMNLPATV